MKVMRRVETRKKQTDTKPLPTGGMVHVHQGRVHKGAGFGDALGAIGDWATQMGDKRAHAELVDGTSW